MKSEENIFEEVKRQVLDVVSKYPSVIGVFVFGSFARGVIAEKSSFWDVDLAIVLDPYDEDVANDLELSFPEKYDIIILNRAPPNILVDVAKNGKLVYVKEERRLNKVMNYLLSDVRRNRLFLKRRGVLVED